MREPDDRRIYSLLIASGIAALVLAAVVATELFAPAAPPAFPHPHLESANLSGLMLCMGVALALWGTSMFYRCSDSVIRANLVATAAVLLVWIFIALVQCSSRSEAVIVACWYSYVVPLTAVPLLVLYNSFRVTSLEFHRSVRVLERLLAVATALLCVLSITNDAHHLLVSFDTSTFQQVESRGVGPLFWVNFAWIAAELAAAFVLILVFSRRKLKLFVVIGAMLVLLVGIFGLLRALDASLMREGTLPLLYTTFIVCMVEASMYVGVLPSFLDFNTLFTRLPFDLKLVVPNRAAVFRTLFRTGRAKQLDPEEKAPLERLDQQQPGVVGFRIPSHPDSSYKVYRIRGALALLTEDVTLLNAERLELEQQQRALQQHNAVLKQNREIQNQLLRQERERELYESIEASLLDSTTRIRALIDALPDGATRADLDERRRMLQSVKMLVAYCKRKGSLVLATKGGADFDRDRVMVIVNEVITDIRTTGADCAAIVEIERVLPAQTVNAIYDCLFGFISAVFGNEDLVMMVFLHTKADDRVELRASAEFAEVSPGGGSDGDPDGDPGAAPSGAPSFEQLEALLAGAAASHRLEAESDSLRMQASFAIGELPASDGTPDGGGAS